MAKRQRHDSEQERAIGRMDKKRDEPIVSGGREISNAQLKKGMHIATIVRGTKIIKSVEVLEVFRRRGCTNLHVETTSGEACYDVAGYTLVRTKVN